MPLMVYNTLSRQQEIFEPLGAPQVRLYTCGPTVYDYAHIGNFRAYVFEDLLRRTLCFSGFKVIQVMNLTDIDDKTIKGARDSGLALNDYTQKYKDAFFEDLEALNIERAEHYPAATDHIPEMIALIEKLVKARYAYQSDDGSVYFSIAKFKEYGKLSHLDMSGLKPGARVAQDEYEKDNAADFALWKAWVEEDGDVGWESPWGRGRPGWHIECSAMSMKYLGPSFDIHTGGVDNIFPHHEDEIAQSEAATGQKFVKYWMHCGYLLVDDRKMSKSMGNFYTLRDVFKRGFSGREVRYALMSVHYRQSLNFTFDALESARGAVQRLDEFSRRLRDVAASTLGLSVSGAGKAVPSVDWADRARQDFCRALNDDLNIAQALATVFDMVHEGNRLLDAGKLTPPGAAGVLRVLEDLDRALGVLRGREESPPLDVLNLAKEREAARREKHWDEADRLRDAIAEQGWVVRDSTDGFKLKQTKSS
ncbi:cysteine--tRNA ligase [Verrucomicrobiota bacterium]